MSNLSQNKANDLLRKSMNNTKAQTTEDDDLDLEDTETETETEAETEVEELEDSDDQLEELEEETEVDKDSPEYLKGEVERLTAALTKANKERARLGKKVKESADSTEVETWKSKAINTALRSALADEGYSASDEAKFKRALRLINTSEISLDNDGEFIGIDEQVASFKSEFPELFPSEKEEEETVTVRKPSTKATAQKAVPKKPSSNQALLNQALGR